MSSPPPSLLIRRSPNANTMSIRSPSSSIFRPKNGIDRSVLDENKKLIADFNRRNLLRGTFSLGALTMLTGCGATDNEAVRSFLRAFSSFNDRVQEAIFRPNHLAPTYREDQVVKPPRFNAYYDVEDVKPLDAKAWKLELSGLIDNKAPWSACLLYT